MSVEFDGDEQAQTIMARFQQTSMNASSGMERWFVKKGIVSTPEASRKILILAMIICFVFSAYLLKKTFSGPIDQRTPAQVRTQDEALNRFHPAQIRR